MHSVVANSILKQSTLQKSHNRRPCGMVRYLKDRRMTTMSLLFAAAAAAAFLVPATSAEPKVIDLSKDFPVGITDNPGARHLEKQLGTDIRRMLVLENGTIVMEYQRGDVDDEELFNLHSATKSFMALFIGVVMDKYNLTTKNTLEQIFTKDEHWADIEDDSEKEFKKSITIYELLTMTSGLDDGVGLNPFPIFLGWWGLTIEGSRHNLYKLFDIHAKNLEELIDIPNAVGKYLNESLSIPGHWTRKKGKFWYLTASNILSYVLKQVTGYAPLEFVSREIFPLLGINQSDVKEVEWDANDDGIQTSFSNLHLTARGIAKLTQLFLQKGLAAPDKRIVSEIFIKDCLTKKINNPDQFQRLGFKNNSYGYLWNTVHLETPGDVSCAWGYNGQVACLNYNTARVSVVQRNDQLWDNFDLDFFDGEWNLLEDNAFQITIEAMSTDFDVKPDPPTKTILSLIIAFVLLCFLLCLVLACRYVRQDGTSRQSEPST